MAFGAIGRGFIEFVAQDSKLMSSLDNIEKRMEGVVSLSNRVGAAGKIAFAGLTAGTAINIKNASDLNEEMNAFRQTFSGLSPVARKFAQDFGQATAQTEEQVLSQLKVFQAFAKGLGLADQGAFDLSKRVVALAKDFGSLHNVSDQESTQRFISFLSGSTEVLDRFGINAKQAALEQQLLVNGITEGVRGASELEKTLARLDIATRALTDQGAIGDARRTSQEFANQIKFLTGNIKALSAAAGQPLIAPVTEYVRKLNEAIPALKQNIQSNVLLAGALNTIAIGVAGIAAGLPSMVQFAILGTLVASNWAKVVPVLTAITAKVTGLIALTTKLAGIGVALIGGKVAGESLFQTLLNIEGIPNKIANKFIDFIAIVRKRAELGIGIIKSRLGTFFSGIGELMIDLIAGDFSNIGEKVKNIFKDTFTGIGDDVGKATKEITEFENALKDAGEFGPKQGAKSFFKEFSENFRKGLAGVIPNEFLDKITGEIIKQIAPPSVGSGFKGTNAGGTNGVGNITAGTTSAAGGRSQFVSPAEFFRQLSTSRDAVGHQQLTEQKKATEALNKIAANTQPLNETRLKTPYGIIAVAG